MSDAQTITLDNRNPLPDKFTADMPALVPRDWRLQKIQKNSCRKNHLVQAFGNDGSVGEPFSAYCSVQRDNVFKPTSTLDIPGRPDNQLLWRSFVPHSVLADMDKRWSLNDDSDYEITQVEVPSQETQYFDSANNTFDRPRTLATGTDIPHLSYSVAPSKTPQATATESENSVETVNDAVHTGRPNSLMPMPIATFTFGKRQVF